MEKVTCNAHFLAPQHYLLFNVLFSMCTSGAPLDTGTHYEATPPISTLHRLLLNQLAIY